VLQQLATGGPDWDDEDDDGYLDDYLRWATFEAFRGTAAMVPFGSMASRFIAGQFTKEPYDDRMTVAPAVSAVESAARAPMAVYKTIFEDMDLSGRTIRDTTSFLTLLSGVPVSALARPIAFVVEERRGKVEAEGPIEYGLGLLSGKGRKAK
jgi:hypothetical protein